MNKHENRAISLCVMGILLGALGFYTRVPFFIYLGMGAFVGAILALIRAFLDLLGVD